MKTTALRVTLLAIIALMLSACQTLFPSYGNDSRQEDVRVSSRSDDSHLGVMSGEPVEDDGSMGGALASGMDNRDRAKLAKALDNAIGKPTGWTNSRTGVRYTVVPVSKATASGNPFCRNYTVKASQGGQVQRSSGVACLGSDGGWHPRN